MMPNQNRYLDYTLEDFLWDENFRLWITSPDADLDIFWNEWLDANPEKKGIAMSAKQILKSLHVKDKYLPDEEIINEVEKIKRRLPDLESQTYARRQFSLKRWHRLAIAASALIVLSLGYYFFTGDNVKNSPYNWIAQNSDTRLFEQVNTSNKAITVTLEDGSRVRLESGAKISFPEHFLQHAKRKVFLNGEAFFEVKKNPKKPFFVYANGLITKVLGTKFTVRSNKGEENSSVEVTEGIVAVYSLIDNTTEDDLEGKNLNNLILTQNQKANFSNENRTLLATLVDNPEPIRELRANYNFKSAPAAQILNTIADDYGIVFLYDEKLLSSRNVTADLRNIGMFAKLSVLCKTLNYNFETVDGKIIISPN